MFDIGDNILVERPTSRSDQTRSAKSGSAEVNSVYQNTQGRRRSRGGSTRHGSVGCYLRECQVNARGRRIGLLGVNVWQFTQNELYNFKHSTYVQGSAIGSESAARTCTPLLCTDSGQVVEYVCHDGKR